MGATTAIAFADHLATEHELALLGLTPTGQRDTFIDAYNERGDYAVVAHVGSFTMVGDASTLLAMAADKPGWPGEGQWTIAMAESTTGYMSLRILRDGDTVYFWEESEFGDTDKGTPLFDETPLAADGDALIAMLGAQLGYLAAGDDVWRIEGTIYNVT